MTLYYDVANDELHRWCSTQWKPMYNKKRQRTLGKYEKKLNCHKALLDRDPDYVFECAVFGWNVVYQSNTLESLNERYGRACAREGVTHVRHTC